MSPSDSHERFLQIAESLKPKLFSTRSSPVCIITTEPSDNALLGWSSVPAGKTEDVQSLHSGDQIIFDFGDHHVGYFSFDVLGLPVGVEPPDAPARLRLIFGEILNDVAENFEPYTGWLSRSWLPDEIINVDFLPQTVKIPRRHAFRYVKIEVIATSSRFGVKFENCIVDSVTSAPLENPPELSFASAGNDMAESEKRLLRRIDRVALRTLRGCMQTVYEDGPRRDMRLWIGDLRLQALCSYATFKDYNLAKRCLYLFAGLPFNEEGLLSACVYEKPTISGGNSIVDYCILFGVAVLDYVKATNDLEAGHDLLPIALRQIELVVLPNLSPEYVYVIPENAPAGGGVGWHFVDWHEKLSKDTAMQCISIFGLKSLIELSSILSLPPPTLHLSLPTSPSIPTSISCAFLAERMTTASLAHHYDTSLHLFVSGPQRQISWASQAWAVIAGIPRSKEEGAAALRGAYEDGGAVGGNTPYVHHYLCEAFIIAGLEDLAVEHIKSYWGSMIDAGADTFFEGWNPKDPRFSPYGDLHVNSFCHAWSCTPALLLRQLGFS